MARERGSAAPVVVLVLVGVAFVAALLVGANQEEGEAGDDPLAEDLNDRIGSIGAVTGEEVTVDCSAEADPADPNALVLAGPCDVDVAAREGEGLRLLRLVAVDPVVVDAPPPDPDADVEVEADLEPGEETAIAVGEDGATVEVSCTGLSTSCSVRLVFG